MHKRKEFSKGPARSPQQVPLDRIASLETDIARSGASSANVIQVFGILDQNRRHAEETGDSYPFTRTLSRLGSALLRRRGLAGNHLDILGTEIERALSWEPMDPYNWMLWAAWFAIQGRDEAREWVLREAVRLFPNNHASRVELARLLVGRGDSHWDEAEEWLREAINRNPDGQYARVELARLLIGRGELHWDEAEQWLREVVEHPEEHAKVELARLLIRRGASHWDEAEHWLREAAKNPEHVPSRVELARLLIERGESHWLEAEDMLVQLINKPFESEHAHVVFAALLIRSNRLSEALGILDKLLARDATNSLARSMRDRLSGGAEIDISAIDASLDTVNRGVESKVVTPSFEAPGPGDWPREAIARGFEDSDAEPNAPSEPFAAERASENTSVRGAEMTRWLSAAPETGRHVRRSPELAGTAEMEGPQEKQARMTLANEIERRGRLSAEFRSALTAVRTRGSSGNRPHPLGGPK